MASRFISPFYDVGSGIKPSSGALLFFFATDGVTPKDTYNDSTATTPNANPVVADSTGVFPDIWITGSYKVTLTDKDLTQKYGGADVEEFATEKGNKSSRYTSTFDELSNAVESIDTTRIFDGSAVDLIERTTGNGGGARWDVVLTSTVTPDGFSIIQSTGIPLLSLVLRLRDNVSARSLGALGDGVTDDSDSIEALANYTHNNDVNPVFQGDFLISRDIEFRRSPKFAGAVTILAAYAGEDADTTVNLYFARRATLKRVTFIFVNVLIATLDPDEQQLLTGSNIKMCNFRTCSLTIGQENQITSGYQVKKCQFSNGTSRTTSAVNIINANNVTIDGIESQDYRNAIYIKPSYSLAANNIEIKNSNAAGFLDAGINIEGTMTYRVSGIKISNTVLAGSIRDTNQLGKAAILAKFACNLEIDNVTATSNSDVLSAQGCLGVALSNSTLSSGKGSVQPCFRFVGCSDVKLKDNLFTAPNTGQYAGLFLSNAINNFVAGNRYPSQNFQMSGGRVTGFGRAVKFEGASDSYIKDVDFDMKDQVESVGLVWSVSGTRVRAYNNQYRAITGGSSPTNGDVITTAPTSSLIPITVATQSVTAPVITASDAALNNAKSYVVEFTLGDVKQLRQLAEGGSPKKILTTWLSDAGVSGTATLAWNSAAWKTTTGDLNDMIVDGTALDNFGVEETGLRVRRCAVVIDYYNRLSCANFGTNAATSLPLGQSTKLLGQKAWQSAAFRPPLVIDGLKADYLIDGDGITNDDWFTQISGRMSIGQKADGTYIILAADGVTDVSGPTVDQLAVKMIALGCEQAFNLDGGGSATLWYQGAIINTPSDGGERAIPAVMYV